MPTMMLKTYFLEKIKMPIWKRISKIFKIESDAIRFYDKNYRGRGDIEDYKIKETDFGNFNLWVLSNLKWKDALNAINGKAVPNGTMEAECAGAVKPRWDEKMKIKPKNYKYSKYKDQTRMIELNRFGKNCKKCGKELTSKEAKKTISLCNGCERI